MRDGTSASTPPGVLDHGGSSSPGAVLDFHREALARDLPGAMEGLVRESVELHLQATPGLWSRVAPLVRGREREFFESLLGMASHEARDVGGLLQDSAAAIGTSGPAEARLALLREVSGRQCCMRRGFLAAAVRGLARGLEGSGEPPVISAEAVLRLRELAAETDAEVAAACQEALVWFRLPPGSGDR